MYRKYSMIEYVRLFLIFTISLRCIPILAQTFNSVRDLSSYESIFGLYDRVPKKTKIGTEGLYSSVDENEYVIDAGDNFIVKIDPPGPVVDVFNVTITSDGYFVIPDVPSLYIRGLKLSEAKILISTQLQKYFPDSNVGSHLDMTHPIHVFIVGAMEQQMDFELYSSNRLYDVMRGLMVTYKSDTTLVLLLDQISLRAIRLIRDDDIREYDMLKFKMMGDRRENPYLMDNDIIYFSYRDTIGYSISVDGSVGQSIEFEYKPSDRLKTAIAYAGGMLSLADSSRIELYRFKGTIGGFEKITMSYPKDSNYVLIPDDRIFVRRKALNHKKSIVWIKGEVMYPGYYPIIEGRTTLSNVIRSAGGFSKFASLKHSKIIRSSEIPGEAEIERLTETFPPEVSATEESYWRFSSRGDLKIVSCDFEKLFTEKDSSEDVVLMNEDIIEISSVQHLVYVTGAVRFPGTVTFNPEWEYEDYIKAVGGYAKRARKRSVKLIKYGTQVWHDAKSDYRIDPGDRIFIPDKVEVDWKTLTKEAVPIISQITTMILIIQNIRRP